MPELTWLVPAACAGQRLDHALAHCLPELGVRGRRRLCERGRVLLQNRPATAAVKVRTGQEVRVLPESCLPPPFSAVATLDGEVQPPFSAIATLDGEVQPPFLSQPLYSSPPCRLPNAPVWIHHDAQLGALYKPAGWHSARLPGLDAQSVEGMLTQLTERLTEQLTEQLPERLPERQPERLPERLAAPLALSTPCLLNRLDRLTSGLLVVALSAAGYAAWQQAEQAGTIHKRYLAVVEGALDAPHTAQHALDTAQRKITRLLAAPHPDPLRHTHITPLAQFVAADLPLTLVQCDIHKGARHQIRTHLAGMGHPLWGDGMYGSTQQHSPWLHHGLVQVAAFTAQCLPPWLHELPEAVRTAALIALAHVHQS